MITPPSILIADDDANIRYFLVRVVQLVSAHAQIVEAADGRAALAAVARHSFDLVITDYNMPHATGVDVLRAVRAQSHATPVVIISARADVEAMVLAAGATTFLTKPFTADALTHILKQLLP